MIQGWLERVGGSVPRGFSRYYILELLKDGPRTGKEIINHAVSQSGGAWKPSPGLIYPLLGRLLDEGLVTESGDNKYALTKGGEATAADIGKVADIVKRQLDVLARLGNVGRFAAMDVIERIISLASALGTGMGDAESKRYVEFLESELARLKGTPKDTNKDTIEGTPKDTNKDTIEGTPKDAAKDAARGKRARISAK